MLGMKKYISDVRANKFSTKKENSKEYNQL